MRLEDRSPMAYLQQASKKGIAFRYRLKLANERACYALRDRCRDSASSDFPGSVGRIVDVIARRSSDIRDVCDERLNSIESSHVQVIAANTSGNRKAGKAG
jgi:hypothetical protein